MSGTLFTVAQWQELEHQALIFKYLKAGLPVPPDLLAPIQKSFQLTSPKFFRHPTCKQPHKNCSKFSTLVKFNLGVGVFI